MLVSIAGSRLSGQTGGARPAIVVVNLRFDGEHANVLQASDTAVGAAATSKLLATLRASELGAPGDSRALAAAGAAARAGGGSRGHPPPPARAPRPRGPPGGRGGHPAPPDP